MKATSFEHDAYAAGGDALVEATDHSATDDLKNLRGKKASLNASLNLFDFEQREREWGGELGFSKIQGERLKKDKNKE